MVNDVKEFRKVSQLGETRMVTEVKQWRSVSQLGETRRVRRVSESGELEHSQGIV